MYLRSKSKLSIQRQQTSEIHTLPRLPGLGLFRCDGHLFLTFVPGCKRE